MINRRDILKGAVASTALLTIPSWTTSALAKARQTSPQISLAQWSLNRAFFAGKLDPMDFAQISSEEYGISAIEYVSAFYKDNINDPKVWSDLKERALKYNVKNLLIMVDDEGDLGDPNDKARNEAVQNHFKWVDAAEVLGCHSIRVNAFGTGRKQEVQAALVQSMSDLSAYASTKGVNILIENHGLYSSDADFIVALMNKVNRSNFGTLPDFGNWCLTAKWGSTQIPCDEAYDRYEGVEKFMPFAKAVSAKSYNFDDQGNDKIIDYVRMLKIVKDSGYGGPIGIEYEGTEHSEDEGIRLTKILIESSWPK